MDRVVHGRATRLQRVRQSADGVLRNHTVSGDGVYRDTVVFSIINQEWPAVRQNLRFLMARGGP